jgi:three-Cys-motif partner protein
MREHEFGGNWTDEKLSCLRGYLTSYTTIFNKNKYARRYITTYMDAFAGTGYRSLKVSGENPSLFDLDDEEGVVYLKGSARIALEVDPPLKKYIFVDINKNHITELEKLKNEFPGRSIQISQSNASDFLMNWLNITDWSKNRAVVFLDPYGMQVKWPLIEKIANTKAIDLWWLFPLGVAINRLLSTNKLPDEKSSKLLNETFGTEDWKKEFYSVEETPTLFSTDESFVKKTATFDKIGQFLVKRLQSVFSKVVENPLYLRNSKEIPIYLFCFAAGNPNGAETAVKIASYLTKR